MSIHRDCKKFIFLDRLEEDKMDVQNIKLFGNRKLQLALGYIVSPPAAHPSYVGIESLRDGIGIEYLSGDNEFKIHYHRDYVYIDSFFLPKGTQDSGLSRIIMKK
jgi:hypothetical protein